MHNVHGLQDPFCLPRVAQRKIKTGIGQLQTWAPYHTRFFVIVVGIAEGKNINIVPGKFEMLLVQFDIVRYAADIRFVAIDHHANSHEPMLRHARMNVKRKNGHGRMETVEELMTAKLILRNKEYEVRAGMTLLDALKKSSVVPESVIATREGEMILEDEILKDGDLIKLIAVISGG